MRGTVRCGRLREARVRVTAVLAAALVLGAGSPAAALAPAAPGRSGTARAEADVAYHGSVVVRDGRVRVRVMPRNHGPDPLAGATLRLRWSEALADRQRLPDDCVRTGGRTVLCGTGALAANGVPGRRVDVTVRLRGEPSEVTVECDTVWRAGAALDRNPRNDRQRVLALDTGDTYVF
ncbi:hypothetical protein [Streptomyces minutiscleroticus]|uniref:hypothetical protein n=1 Tax=Streptomyces minutiscleroticus TaxID=68238 RepID=UPI00331C2254